MCFEQRPADLLQQKDYARFRQWSVIGDQFLKVDPVEIFHCIVENVFRRPAVVVDADCAWMVELAGNLYLTFKASHRLIVDHIQIQQFDGSRSAKHGVISFVNNSHRSSAQFVFKSVLSKLLCFDGCCLCLTSHLRNDQGEYQNRNRADSEHCIQRPERSLQNRQGQKCFCNVNLCCYSNVVLGEPCPRAYNRHAAIVVVADDVVSGSSACRRIGHQSHRPCFGFGGRRRLRPDIRSGITDVYFQRTRFTGAEQSRLAQL